jgi:hypothetical protein
MGIYSDADRTATRIPASDQEIREQRDDKARRNVAAFASWQPDPAEWEADILAYLGLDVETSTRPSPVRLLPPDEVTGPGKRAKDADAPVEPVDPAHVPGSSYKRGCPCDTCREKHNAYQADYMRRRRLAAQTDGRPMPPSTTSAAQRRRAEAKAERAAYIAAFHAEAIGDIGGQS